MKVKDERLSGGKYLWILGDRKTIEPVIKKAVEEFSISGAYGVCKIAGLQAGWCTKTKK